MNYCCPNCETNLKGRYMPTKGLGKAVAKLPYPISKTIKQRVVICPNCDTALSVNAHPFDQALSRWGAFPLAIFFVSLFLESLTIKVIAGVALVLGIAWAMWVITKPSYKKW